MRSAKKAFIAFLIAQFLFPATLNVTASGYRYGNEAIVLNKINIYAGVNSSYFEPDLGSKLQRQSAVILLVKMFGKQAAADAMSKTEVDGILSKYTDNKQLASFARPYMAYAVKYGMVSGNSKTTLGPTALIDSPSFACMILKNMGYTVPGSPAFTHSLDTLGGLAGMKPEDISSLNNKILIRDDVVGIIYWALRAATASGDALIASLIRDGVVTGSTAVDQNLVKYDAATGTYKLIGPDPKPITDRDAIYDRLRDALLNVSPTVVLPVNSASDTIDKVWAIIQDVLADNPNILYFSEIKYWESTGLLEFTYTRDIQTAKDHAALLETKVQSILAGIITRGMTDYQKEIAIHDYLINNCSYDQSIDPPPESNCAYGVLCLNKAVCIGYAKAAQLLFNEAGVECLLVSGNASDGKLTQGHSWNMVKIGAQYYHLDITWDDPIMPDGSSILRYKYFNLADSVIARTHVWKTSSFPACTALTYNYYDYNGFIVKGYDAFVAYVIDKYKKGGRYITVKVSDNENPGFDFDGALAAIKKAIGIYPLKFKPADAYGIIDLWFQ